MVYNVDALYFHKKMKVSVIAVATVSMRFIFALYVNKK